MMTDAKFTLKETVADARLRREYSGFTLADHRRVFEYQNKCCAICKKPVLPGKPRLAVDHDHTTGLLRGLLCPWCNRALARFKDNVKLLLAAAEYLKHPPISLVFGCERYTAPGRIGTKKRAKLLKLMESNLNKGPNECTKKRKIQTCRSRVRG